jgi:hypothetical protein
VNGLVAAGFSVDAVHEPPLLPEDDTAVAYYDRTIDKQREVWERLPYVLIVVARKST